SKAGADQRLVALPTISYLIAVRLNRRDQSLARYRGTLTSSCPDCVELCRYGPGILAQDGGLSSRSAKNLTYQQRRGSY
ncbi:MAG: hypothetical protein M3Y84_02175, partial [Acidobacteriota bacterium]|nr:hypothetical protein [Acidobacteriota bacterium]